MQMGSLKYLRQNAVLNNLVLTKMNKKIKTPSRLFLECIKQDNLPIAQIAA